MFILGEDEKGLRKIIKQAEKYNSSLLDETITELIKSIKKLSQLMYQLKIKNKLKKS